MAVTLIGGLVEGCKTNPPPVEHSYFVSYLYEMTNQHGYGRLQMQMQRPITNMDDIKEIEHYIKAQCPGITQGPIITFYKEMP